VNLEIQVVQPLRGDGGEEELKMKSFGGREIMLDACDLEDYTCTTYLNDLKRHRQLTLE
ncbi:non-specific serine,threonine protein kinase, partial [Sarracenia purpurea var. burkii]